MNPGEVGFAGQGVVLPFGPATALRLADQFRAQPRIDLLPLLPRGHHAEIPRPHPGAQDLLEHHLVRGVRVRGDDHEALGQVRQLGQHGVGVGRRGGLDGGQREVGQLRGPRVDERDGEAQGRQQVGEGAVDVAGAEQVRPHRRGEHLEEQRDAAAAEHAGWLGRVPDGRCAVLQQVLAQQRLAARKHGLGLGDGQVLDGPAADGARQPAGVVDQQPGLQLGGDRPLPRNHRHDHRGPTRAPGLVDLGVDVEHRR